MDERKTLINPPLYLANTTMPCWRCDAEMPVVALIAPKVPEETGEVCILADIVKLPAAVLAFVQNRFPSFKMRLAKNPPSEYHVNTCPGCGYISRDFYLHAKPGDPFFPESEADAARLSVEQIPIDGSIEVFAGLSIGNGDLILKQRKKISCP